MSEVANGHGLYVPNDPGITRFSTGHFVERTTINDHFIMVESPWLGDFVIQDQLSYDLYTTPAFLRSTAVSQLCKSRESSTIPNLASFERGWGLLDQHFLVDYFGHKENLSDEEISAIHIAIEGDDQAHPAFSHQFELAVQKWGGPENWHEDMWPKIAELGGQTAVLDKHGVRYDERIRVPGKKIPKWAERTDRKDIDLDNLQYIATEGLLCFDNDYVDPEVREKIKRAIDLSNFVITPDGELACTNPETALVLAKLHLLATAEHYNDPFNRTHMHLGIHGGQRIILTRRLAWMNRIDKGQTRVPTSYFHAIDQDFTDAMRTGPGNSDDFIYLVSNVLNKSGMEERRRFTDYKVIEYARFIGDDLAQDYPSEYLDPKRVDFGPSSSSVQTEVVELTPEEEQKLSNSKIPRLEEGSDALTYTAGPLKNRWIDPLVRQGDSFVRLSEIGSLPYKSLLEQHQRLQKLGIKVSFAFPRDYAGVFRGAMLENDAAFEALEEATHAPMTSDQFRQMIELGARRAVEMRQAAGSLVLKTELKF